MDAPHNASLSTKTNHKLIISAAARKDRLDPVNMITYKNKIIADAEKKMLETFFVLKKYNVQMIPLHSNNPRKLGFLPFNEIRPCPKSSPKKITVTEHIIASITYAIVKKSTF